jgi:2'-5' RNA ligase
VELTEPLRKAIVEKCGPVKNAVGPKVHWTKPENIHLTMKFLGDIHRDDIVTALDIIKEAVAGQSSVPAEVRGPEPFPPGSRARMVVAPVDEVEQLIRLHSRLDRGFAELGVKREKRGFLPHITLARARDTRGGWQASFDWQAVSGKIGVLPVTAVTFFMSELGPGGPTYTPLGKVQIG